MRLIVVSNRLPVTLKCDQGQHVFHRSAGGLATGLSSLDPSIDRVWVGWPGASVEDADKDEVSSQLNQEKMVPVFLSDSDYAQFYEGFSNSTIWPLFHYFPQYTVYDEDCWESYRDVNVRFMEVVSSILEEGDVVWVHDYQLMLLPSLLRSKYPSLSIGFFLHIPFPSYELFRTLQWRTEILNGMLGADLIGFHTFDYMRHFLSATYRIIGCEHNFGRLDLNGRCVKVDVMPMGIDYDKFAFSIPKPEASDEVKTLIELSQKVQIILSLDRLDYSKGIPLRIRAFKRFLQKYPEWKGKVTLLLVVVPSRDTVEQYQQLKEEIELLVGRIHGELGTMEWSPIRYFYRPFAWDSLVALYQLSQVALVTPVRDGMNLVAKEFVACKHTTSKGVLILSEMAGAASELDDALLINPCDQSSMVNALQAALTMSEGEQSFRLKRMQKTLRANNIKQWAKTFIEAQLELRSFQQQRESLLLTQSTKAQLIEDFKTSHNRLLLLDYGGTLRDFTKDPDAASPDDKLRDTLRKLAQQKGTQVVLMSGREKTKMIEWFGDLGLDMICEHGALICRNGQWRTFHEGINGNWQDEVLPLLEKLVQTTSGSHVEIKQYNLAWHYRRADKELGENHLREIRQHLTYLTANHQLQVVEGNNVVEVMQTDVNKGRACNLWVLDQQWDFILALGDDHSDEEAFEALPSTSYTVKVGVSPNQETRARFKVRSINEAREILEKLSNLTF